MAHAGIIPYKYILIHNPASLESAGKFYAALGGNPTVSTGVDPYQLEGTNAKLYYCHTQKDQILYLTKIPCIEEIIVPVSSKDLEDPAQLLTKIKESMAKQPGTPITIIGMDLNKDEKAKLKVLQKLLGTESCYVIALTIPTEDTKEELKALLVHCKVITKKITDSAEAPTATTIPKGIDLRATTKPILPADTTTHGASLTASIRENHYAADAGTSTSSAPAGGAGASAATAAPTSTSDAPAAAGAGTSAADTARAAKLEQAGEFFITHMAPCTRANARERLNAVKQPKTADAGASATATATTTTTTPTSISSAPAAGGAGASASASTTTLVGTPITEVETKKEINRNALPYATKTANSKSNPYRPVITTFKDGLT